VAYNLAGWVKEKRNIMYTGFVLLLSGRCVALVYGSNSIELQFRKRQVPVACKFQLFQNFKTLEKLPSKVVGRRSTMASRRNYQALKFTHRHCEKNLIGFVRRDFLWQSALLIGSIYI
jgi:hypothetical protein